MNKPLPQILCFAMVTSLVIALPATADDAIKRQILKLFPQADANKDGVISDAEEAAVSRQAIKRHPRADRDGDGVLSDVEKQDLLKMAASRAKTKSDAEPSVPSTDTTVDKWNTVGLQQANTMGGGEAEIPKRGKLRVFVLMGQSNMNGSGRASELESPYTERHDRIRIWANGRWEYMVPSNKFGPGVSFAHQLADFWADDTIGIIKVSCGATGISAFEKNWSFERAERSKDGKKGSMYKDLMNAVAEAKRISNPEFCGFVWKQAAADGKKGLAEEYYDNFKQLVSDLGADLGVADLPTFVPSYATDKELLKGVLSRIDKENALEAKKSAGEGSEKTSDMLEAVLSYIDANGLFATKSPVVKKQRYLATVISAQNRAGRDMPNVTTIYPGRLPIGKDGVHYSSAGYITLGKITATAVEEFYKAKE